MPNLTFKGNFTEEEKISIRSITGEDSSWTFWKMDSQADITKFNGKYIARLDVLPACRISALNFDNFCNVLDMVESSSTYVEDLES